MSTELHKDIEYYIEPLIFQVENTLFRIPREYLSQESAIFRDMLQIPQPENSDFVEGYADAKPIKLPQISTTSFRLLLKFLFNLEGSRLLFISKESLITLLELSRRWEMKTIRDKVIDQLHSHLLADPAHKWNLAKDYGISQWMQPALEQLIRRNEPLGEWEYLSLDQDTFLAVAAIREDCYPVFQDTHGYNPADIISRWELKQGRGAIEVSLDSIVFECPRPAPHLDDDGSDAQSHDRDTIRDGEFYFEHVVFQLGKRFYKVPNQPFAQHSPIFRRRFEKLGFTQYDYENPCVLPAEISPTDFTNLLRFFFPPTQTMYKRTSEEWASVLRLASRWEMEAVKALAVKELTQHDFGTPTTKLQLAKDLGVQLWFSESMRALITRNEPLGPSEYQTLDLPHILQVIDLRERLHTRQRYGYGQVNQIRTERGELPESVSLSDRLTPLL